MITEKASTLGPSVLSRVPHRHPKSFPATLRRLSPFPATPGSQCHPERSEGSQPAGLRTERKTGVFSEGVFFRVGSFGLRPQQDSEKEAP